MKILLTGANGYIGRRLLPVLLEKGHTVTVMVRDRGRFSPPPANSSRIRVLEMDLLTPDAEAGFPEDIDVAFFLVHSMSSTKGDFEQLEQTAAKNFVERVNATQAKQIVYLGGLANAEELSKHLQSRRKVEDVLASATARLTTLRAGIILGSGSASFEIVRDLVEKLPVMITPKWLKTRCQPIAVRNVIQYLTGVMLNKKTFGKTFDIGGPDILTYKEMLLRLAAVRGLKRFILTLPVMTPRLSSYWLYFVTSTSYNLAVNLVDSMKIEVVCANDDVQSVVPLDLIGFDAAVRLALERIEQNNVLSSWKDAMIAGRESYALSSHISVPAYGCFRDAQRVPVTGSSERVVDTIWSIGGKRGWYYADVLWTLRGFLDKVVGGVGIRRGRTNLSALRTGDALDFWRVLYANREERRLLLYAEMKLPGEAWLEFAVKTEEEGDVLEQTATFRPKGLLGRAYWYALYPFHVFIFSNMAKNIERYKRS
jgi:uncharacterized protein YbjT (DUF2867 family)